MAKKKLIVSKYGQWKYPGQETIIPNVNGRITMRGVPYPVLGIDDLGNQQMMMPGAEYKFPGNSVYEIPMANRNIMDRGFDRGSGNSTGVNWPTELTNEQRALDDWQKLTSNGRPTFEKRIPAPDDKTYQQLLSRSQGGPSSSDKGMFLGHFQFKDGGLVRMQPGGSATDKNDPKKTDNSQPYMYLDQKTNTWLRPPENRDQNQMIDWSVNTPAISTGTMNIQGGKKVSPEEAARAKEYYRQEALKTPEGQEEERQRLMQEFVDQQNNSKSPLQASLGNLSLDNPATRDAARNYAGYKMGQSSPLNAFDRLSTGRDTPATTDFYRPNEATYSFGIPAAAVMAPIAAEAAIAAAPVVGESFQALRTAAQPMGQAWNTVLNAPRFGNNALTLGNAFKTLSAYDLSHKYIPNTIDAGKMYYETGDTKYLKDMGYNALKGGLELSASMGPFMHEMSAAKKPVSLVDDARKMTDADKDVGSRTLSGVKTFKNTLGYMKEQGGGVFLGKFKQVGGQLVPHDTDMGSFQKGGQPIHVYSKNDPAYKKYLKQKAYYDQQKAIYENAAKIQGRIFKDYDELVEQSYKNAKTYKEKFDPDLGIPDFYYTGLPLDPNTKKIPYFGVRKPAPVILEKEVKPKAIDIKPLPMPQSTVELKPLLQNLPVSKTKGKTQSGSKEHYTIASSGNPGQSYLWKYVNDGNGNSKQELIGSVFNRDFLTDEQQAEYDAPGGGTTVVDYDPTVQKVYSDQRDINKVIEDERGVKQKNQSNLSKAQQEIEAEKARQEQWQQQQREKQKKKIQETSGLAYGGEPDPRNPKVSLKSKSKSGHGDYVVNQTMYSDGTHDTNTRRSLKGFITGAPKPGGPLMPRDISVPNLSRQDGGGIDYEAIKDPELAARARAMGHNTIAEYRDSNWGYGKNMQQPASANTAPIAGVTGPPSYILPTLEIKGTKSTPNRLPYKNVDTSNSEPVPKFLEPGFQDYSSYLEAKNKLRLRQEVESAQARFEGGEDIFSAIEDRDKAENALNEMYKKYPNDKRLTAKEMEVSQALGKFMVEQGIEKGIFKGLPLISANQKYLDIVQSLQGASNIKNLFDIQDVLDSKQRGDDKYAYYTEELKDKVDAYEKAHGTYQPGLMDKIQALMPNKQDGGDMPFGLPLKEQNIYTLPEYNQPRNPKTGEILPDPRRPNLGMDTGATEYKYTYGTDEGDIDIPSIVAGQYIGDQALDRYNLTGERFKTMTDPGSYSNFYDQISQLGLMQEKQGGAVKRVKIKSLPKNWKSQ